MINKLDSGTKIHYIYDMGSTTDIFIEILNKLEG